MLKPRVFIVSSSESLGIAKAVELGLSKYCECTVWDAAFELSKSSLENLSESVKSHGFAVVVITPDDLVQSRGKTYGIPRDNVLFELGLFVGRWGKERTYIVCDLAKTKLPSDWLGIKVAQFDLDRAKTKETFAALSPACTEILHAIKSTPERVERLVQNDVGSTLPGVDELLMSIASASRSQTRVVIAHTETSWAWKLFPTILEWRIGRVPVDVLLTRPLADERRNRQETYRRRLLQQMGARVLERRTLPFTGFFLDADDERNMQAIVVNPDSSDRSPLGMLYKGGGHAAASRSLLSQLRVPSVRKDATPLLLVNCKEAKLISIIKNGVSQYKDGQVEIVPTVLKTQDLLLISRYARAYKYRQIGYLAEMYRKKKIEAFRAMSVRLSDGSNSIVTPPVVEKRNEGLVVIEGNTRAVYCYKNKIENFPCLLVSNVAEALPSAPFAISGVVVAERTLPPEERMEDFDYSKFRHIERAVHPY